MRVCFYSTESDWSGRPRAFRDGALELAARGYEVTAVCPHDSEAGRVFSGAGLTVIAMRGDGNSIASGWRLSRALRRHFTEVVFVHSEREQLHAALAVRFAGRGAVVRRVPPLARLTTGRDARLASRLAGTGYLFSFDGDLRGSTPPPRALEPVVAPPGARAGAPSRTGVAGERSIVCTYDSEHTGRVAVALRTTAMLAANHPELRLTLFGPGDPRETVRIQAAALGIGHIVRFVPGSADNSGLMVHADLAWVLADGDAAAFACLDALSAGVPILAERSPLSTRFVEDDVSGILTGTLDAAAGAATISALFADWPRRQRLGHGAAAAAPHWPLAATGAGFERAASAARDRTRWGV